MRTLLEEKLLQKSLNFKFSDIHEKILEHVMDEVEKEGRTEVNNIKLKNICAYVPQVFADRLEDTLALLKMSKREFVTLALEEALDKADAIMDECGVTKYLDELAEHQAKEREAA